MSLSSTQVLVVGAGPVGLATALDLASRGIEVLVAEIRHAGEPPSVKSNHVSARTMEIFRRLGIVKRVRNAGLPADFPNDCSYRTTATGRELTRIPIPSRAERYTSRNGPDTWWPTPEPPHRINQIYLEPILFECASAHPLIKILSRTKIESFEQTDHEVVALARNIDTGTCHSIEASYLIGCDGGRSNIRKLIGATFTGTAVVQRVQSTYIRAPHLKDAMKEAPAWMIMSLNPRRSGTTVAIDGHEKWLIHNHLKAEETEFDQIDRDWAIRTILGVDERFSYEVLSKEDWIGRRLFANRLRNRRAFICGDAAHLWVPYAGYGMNAGIADAANLCWLLALHLHGHAPATILDAYEAERLPISEQVSRFAMNHAIAMMRQRRDVPDDIEDETPEGEASRTSVGKAAYDLNVQQYCCAGLNFGYYYERSPIIAYDGATAPPYSMGSFEASTNPGVRAPHFWLRDGRSVYDAFGPAYTLCRFDNGIDVSKFMLSALAKDLPITLLDIDSDGELAIYRDTPVVLVRSDQHIAWRGKSLPVDPAPLVDLLRGA